jgi:hypothetical protein
MSPFGDQIQVQVQNCLILCLLFLLQLHFRFNDHAVPVPYIQNTIWPVTYNFGSPQGAGKDVRCSQYKIALLFLTRGPMPHERLWARWLEGAVGLVPMEILRERNCSKAHVNELRFACQAHPGVDPVEAQHLFTIYIHPKPDYPRARLFLTPLPLLPVNFLCKMYLSAAGLEPKYH